MAALSSLDAPVDRQAATDEDPGELGGKVAFANPCGTCKHAFKGNGEVKRNDHNRAWAAFQSGKRYNLRPER